MIFNFFHKNLGVHSTKTLQKTTSDATFLFFSVGHSFNESVPVGALFNPATRGLVSRPGILWRWLCLETNGILEILSWFETHFFQNRKSLYIGFDDFMPLRIWDNCYWDFLVAFFFLMDCRCWSEEVNTENSPQVAAVTSLLCL